MCCPTVISHINVICVVYYIFYVLCIDVLFKGLPHVKNMHIALLSDCHVGMNISPETRPERQ